MVTPIYVYAGYLPPGKMDIYIYDRSNREMLYKEVIIDTASRAGKMEGPEFRYIPDQLEQEQLDAIDVKFEEEFGTGAKTGGILSDTYYQLKNLVK